MSLPRNLLDALRYSEASGMLKSALGEGTVAACAKLRHVGGNDYARHLTTWKRRTTLD